MDQETPNTEGAPTMAQRQAHFHVTYRSQATRNATCVATSQSLAGARRILASLLDQGFVTFGWTRCNKDHGAIANAREDAA
jgi:hypothetical protein